MADHQIIERIRKLLALAKNAGATEAEAASALAAASAMMLKYNIDHVDEHDVIIGNNTPPGYKEKWHIYVGSGVCELYSCRSVIDSDGRWQFAGRPLNVQATTDSFIAVSAQVEGFYKQALDVFNRINGRTMTKAERHDFRTTFKEACALKIFQRCKEIMAAPRNQIPVHKALVVIDQAKEQAEDLLNKTFNSIKSRAVSITRSGRGTGAGLLAGDHVKLQDKVR
jgi:hypothetical protein